jgi:hypothetical protein
MEVKMEIHNDEKQVLELATKESRTGNKRIWLLRSILKTRDYPRGAGLY